MSFLLHIRHDTGQSKRMMDLSELSLVNRHPSHRESTPYRRGSGNAAICRGDGAVVRAHEDVPAGAAGSGAACHAFRATCGDGKGRCLALP